MLLQAPRSVLPSAITKKRKPKRKVVFAGEVGPTSYPASRRIDGVALIETAPRYARPITPSLYQRRIAVSQLKRG
jgi:hypothetical protein